MLYLIKRLCYKVISVFYLFRETNVVFKLVPKVAYRCCHRPCCCIAKRADCVTLYFALYVPKQVDIFFAAVAVLYTVQYFFHPAGAFAAR